MLSRWSAWRRTQNGEVIARVARTQRVYVDGVRAWDADGHLVFNGEHPADAARFTPTGWIRSSN